MTRLRWPLTDGLPLLQLVTRPNAAFVASTAGRIYTGRTGRVVLRALVDTGADSTMVCLPHIERFGLRPTGRIKIGTASGSGKYEFCDQYLIGLTVQDEHSSIDLGESLVAANRFDAGVDALIGLDILRQCDFVFNGRRGEFSLEF